MKKILTILFISFSVAAQSQVLQTPQIFGTLYRNLGAKEGLVIPTFCGTPTLPPSVKNYAQSAIAYDSCNHIFYVFSPTDSTWKTISGSGLDSLAFHSASVNSDSTQLSLTRVNGTKDTIEIWGGGFVGGVQTVTGTAVNNTDPHNPVINSTTSPYKVYTAILNQSGTNAPVATVLQNTLGCTVSYAYSGVGWYTVTLSSPLMISGKTAFFSQNPAFSPIVLFELSQSDVSNLTLHTRKTDGTAIDGSMNASFFEIRIYN